MKLHTATATVSVYVGYSCDSRRFVAYSQSVGLYVDVIVGNFVVRQHCAINNYNYNDQSYLHSFHV